MEKKRIAIVLFNLGGPDKGDSVQPFLFNLFNDKAIIGVPQPMRFLLAKLISTRRAPIAREIYDHIGGGSPLLPNTEAQATALTACLDDLGTVKCFLAMRYWHPLTAAAVDEVKAFAPDEIVLLPLYPQFSTTTTGSSLSAWRQAAVKAGLTAPVRTVCCYPDEPGFIKQSAQQINSTLEKIHGPEPIRVLFSAHGLPKRIVEGGDPYQFQVEQTAAAIGAHLTDPRVSTLVCYQSKVGPLEWIGPSTEDEIARAGEEKMRLLIFPLAFVSEHSETLVELDIEYREIAEHAGVPEYHRVATVGTGAAFIEGLASVVRGSLGRTRGLAADGGKRFCPQNWKKCPCRDALEAL
jgi:ferrochelatase